MFADLALSNPQRAVFPGRTDCAKSLLDAQIPSSEIDFNGAPCAAARPLRDDRSPNLKYQLVEHNHADRGAAEQFIAERFAAGFNAQIQAFMPRLFSVRRSDDSICGAFGLRCAHRPLFVEHYLDEPIEESLARFSGLAVRRSHIVEVGHLCGAFPGAMRALILLLIERLHQEGFGWVAFTATTALRNAFHRLGLLPLDIAAADIEAIPGEARAAWGNYYQHAPRVLAGKIGDGFVALRRSPELTSREIDRQP